MLVVEWGMVLFIFFFFVFFSIFFVVHEILRVSMKGTP